MIDNQPRTVLNFRETVGRGLVAHLMVISHFVQKNTLDKLLESGSYDKLSLSYAYYIPILAEAPCTPGQLATRLGISKQACSKTIRELEKQGIVCRSVNPTDSRSSLLTLSPSGLQLLQDGMRVTNALYEEMCSNVGDERMKELDRVAEVLRVQLGIPQEAYTFANESVQSAPRLNALVPQLSEALRLNLADMLKERGFSGLKSSFGQILGLVGRQGRHIQYMASILGVSKQSVAASVSELDDLGYVVRDPDPNDRRQVIVKLSPKGELLMAQSLASVQELEARIHQLLGDDDYQILESTLKALYLQLAESYDSAGVLPARIQQLSDFLLEELGVAGTRTLAQHLLNITRGNS